MPLEFFPPPYVEVDIIDLDDTSPYVDVADEDDGATVNRAPRLFDITGHGITVTAPGFYVMTATLVATWSTPPDRLVGALVLYDDTVTPNPTGLIAATTAAVAGADQAAVHVTAARTLLAGDEVRFIFAAPNGVDLAIADTLDDFNLFDPQPVLAPRMTITRITN